MERRNSVEMSEEKKLMSKAWKMRRLSQAARLLENFTLRKRNQSIFKAETPRRSF